MSQVLTTIAIHTSEKQIEGYTNISAESLSYQVDVDGVARNRNALTIKGAQLTEDGLSVYFDLDLGRVFGDDYKVQYDDGTEMSRHAGNRVVFTHDDTVADADGNYAIDPELYAQLIKYAEKLDEKGVEFTKNGAVILSAGSGAYLESFVFNGETSALIADIEVRELEEATEQGFNDSYVLTNISMFGVRLKWNGQSAKEGFATRRSNPLATSPARTSRPAPSAVRRPMPSVVK